MIKKTPQEARATRLIGRILMIVLITMALGSFAALSHRQTQLLAGNTQFMKALDQFAAAKAPKPTGALKKFIGPDMNVSAHTVALAGVLLFEEAKPSQQKALLETILKRMKTVSRGPTDYYLGINMLSASIESPKLHRLLGNEPPSVLRKQNPGLENPYYRLPDQTIDFTALKKYQAHPHFWNALWDASLFPHLALTADLAIIYMLSFILVNVGWLVFRLRRTA